MTVKEKRLLKILNQKIKMKTIFILISAFTLFSCQTRQTRIDAEKGISTPSTPSMPGRPEESGSTSKPPVIYPQTDSKPEKFGLIFSAGGVRTWSYINILKEMQKYKMPIVAVAGMEWGSVIAGVYAENISANEVEWELSKFKAINDWQSFVKKIFEKKSVTSLKIPFGCSSLNLKTQTSYILNKGQLDALVPFCVPSPGIARPYTDSIASMTEGPGLIQFLKSQGATKIILINAISTKSGRPHGSALDSLENQFWIQASAALNKKVLGVDEVIEIDLSYMNVEKFDQRRDVLNAPIPQAKDQLKRIANKYGF